TPLLDKQHCWRGNQTIRPEGNNQVTDRKDIGDSVLQLLRIFADAVTRLQHGQARLALQYGMKGAHP
ncbi:MAG: hypothetical protein AB7J94_09760, partial [Geobacter sp.]